MTTEIPLAEITKLKEILRDVATARSDLEIVLDELVHWVQSQSVVDERVQDLERRLESAKNQLDAATSERDKARRELSQLRDSVDHAIRQGTLGIYRVIGRQSPFEQLDLLKRSKREADNRIAALANENKQLQARVGELEASVSEGKSELEKQIARIDSLNGLVDRYKEELDRYPLQLEEVRRESRHAVLGTLIDRVTPRRLAALIDVVDDTGEGIVLDSDTLKFVKWLVQYLKSIGLRVTYRLGQEIPISESELHNFRLDEEYRTGSLFQVISPGFALGEHVLTKAKVRYAEKTEDQNGSSAGRHGNVGEEIAGGAQAPGTSGRAAPADGQAT